MLNKIHEITRLLTYSYTPENRNIIDNILNSTIERCESLYYKTVLYPQLETIWSAEQNNNNPNYYHLENSEATREATREATCEIASEATCEIASETSIDTPHSSITCSQLNYKTINTLNKNKLSTKQQYMLKDITVLIYIYVATQPISVFSTNQ